MPYLKFPGLPLGHGKGSPRVAGLAPYWLYCPGEVKDEARLRVEHEGAPPKPMLQLAREFKHL